MTALGLILSTIAADPQPIRATIDKGVLTLQGRVLKLPCPRSQLVKVLGEPDRLGEGLSYTQTWDKLGVYALADLKHQHVVEVDFCVVGGLDLPFAPKQAFRGSLKLDGATVTRKSTVKAINRDKEGKKLTQAVEQRADWFTFKHGNRSVFVTTDSKCTASVSAVGPLPKGLRICE